MKGDNRHMEQKVLERSNTIGIVGIITDKPYLILDASEWRKRLYETKLERVRPSGAKDIFILRFDGSAAGTEKKIEEIVKGVEVMIGGEIRTENVYDPRPEENRVKVYIYAEMIAVNDPPVDDQNEVTIRGNICCPPYYRQTRSRTVKGKRRTVTNLIVAVNSNKGTNYIPCVCFGWQAFLANALEVGDYVEIYGRFQSRERRKRIDGQKPPYLVTVYEVCANKIEGRKIKEAGQKEERGSDV